MTKFFTESVATTLSCAFQNRRAEDERVGIEQARSEPHLRQVQVAVHDLVNQRPLILVQIDEANLQAAIFGRQAIVAEVLVRVPGAIFRRVRDYDGAAMALAQVIEDAA